MYNLNQFSSKYQATLSQTIYEKVETEFSIKLKELNLPEELISTLKLVYIPLYSAIIKDYVVTNKPLVIGICGAQGSGKTTFAQLLSLVLEKGFNLKVVAFSIDDFYLTREQRLQLSKNVHPLLATRGVPGTHDSQLGIDVLNSLLHRNNKKLPIPQFNKAMDDRFPPEHWKFYKEFPDVILFEGWCVGATPQTPEELKTPVNELEKREDSDLSFREYVNDCLMRSYTEWFSMIDKLVYLKAPSFDKVLEWRLLQEEKLKNQISGNFQSTKIMSPDEVRRFISFFERLTKHILSEIPARADVVFEIDNNHLICAAGLKQNVKL